MVLEVGNASAEKDAKVYNSTKANDENNRKLIDSENERPWSVNIDSERRTTGIEEIC